MLNLVIALLGTSRGRSRHFIRENVNGYARTAATAALEATAGPAFERMFERDKDTLREVGIPITTITSFDDEDQEQVLYRIKPADYRVPEVRLSEDAMTMLAVAANLWSEAAFSAAAQSALRKVATRAGLGWYDDDATVQSRVRTLEPAFQPLWTALRENSEVTFDYRPAGSATTTSRAVKPWGLGSRYGEWYLSGFDTARGAQRNFRLSRITSTVVQGPSGSFARPEGFSIASVLDSLGSSTVHTARISVPAGTGHELRTREGATVETDGAGLGRDIVTLSYREPELMAADLASLGAGAAVIEPDPLRQAVAGRLQAALAAADEPTPLPAGTLAAGTSGARPPLGPALPRTPAKRNTTRDRLVRLLSMVPFLVANPGIPEEELCSEFGISGRELEADLGTLMVSGLPGYLHGDLMDVTTEHGQVFIRDAETLASPLRLTQEEACALLVGLDALKAVPGTDKADALQEAITQVKRVAGPDAWLADAVALQLLTGTQAEAISVLQGLIRDGQACHAGYLVRSRDELTQRTIEPRRIYSIDSTWYVRAWCRTAGALRSFRVDLLSNLTPAGPQLNPAPDTAVDVGSVGAPYTPGDHDHEVLLLADDSTARRLAPAYNATLHRLDGTAGGEVAVRMLVGEPATIPPLLARLAGHARVVHPPELRESARAWLAAAAASYAGKSGAHHAVGESSPATPGLDG